MPHCAENNYKDKVCPYFILRHVFSEYSLKFPEYFCRCRTDRYPEPAGLKHWLPRGKTSVKSLESLLDIVNSGCVRSYLSSFGNSEFTNIFQ